MLGGRVAVFLGLVALVLVPAPSAGAATAGGVNWSTYGFNVARTGYNPRESKIGPANVRHLHQLWSRNLGGTITAQPLEVAGVRVDGRATNVVYEGTERGDLYALREQNGGVIWHKNLGAFNSGCDDMEGDIYGITGPGTIALTARGHGVIYVAGNDGAVHALDLATGAEQPHWPVRGAFVPTQTTVFGGLTLFHGELYLTTAGYCDNPPYYGGIAEISLTRHRVTHRFFPAGPPAGRISGGGIWGPGGVSVNPSNGNVFAATGNAITTPENYLYSDAVVALSPSLQVLSSAKPTLTGSDLDFGATPILFRPTGCRTPLIAAKNKSGLLFIYPAKNLAAQPRQSFQIATAKGSSFNGIPAWDPVTNMLYVSNPADSDDGRFLHGLVALKAGPGCALSLAWQHTVRVDGLSVSPPTVANGVVYFGNGFDNTEFAVDARTGKQLWSSSGTTRGPVLAAPTVANGVLLVASWDHHLYAFVP